MVIKCYMCGVEFNRSKSHLAKKNFCSIECRNKFYLSLRVNLICKNCGKEFTVLSKYKNNKYCSNKCFIEYVRKHPQKTRVGIECAVCKKTFYVYPHKKDKRKFCSKTCSKIWYSRERKNVYMPQGIDGRFSRKALVISKRYNIIKTRALKLGVPISDKKTFLLWYESQRKFCEYCGMPEEVWETFYAGFHNKYSLSIDRKDNNLGYTPDNMVLACGICNTIKTNVLSWEEMKEIGEKYIKPKWKKRILEGKDVRVGL